MLRLKELGEASLINYLCRRLTKKIGKSVTPEVSVIGDDAFIAKLSPRQYLVAATDTLVEDVHFRRKWINFSQLGWRALAVTLSDFAAMGAITPRYVLLNLGLPPELPFKAVKELYQGIEKLSQRWRIVLAGGNTVRTEKIILTVFLIGETTKNNFISRSGARIGDLIFSTGPLGEAAAGLFLLKKGYRIDNPRYKKLIRRHLLPQPRLEEGKILAKEKLATSLIDCSDGLEKSVKLLIEKNSLGAEIYLENLPLTPDLESCIKTISGVRRFPRSVAETMERKRLKAFWKLAIYGGEDYELIFTAQEKNYQKIVKFIPQAFFLGKIRKKKGIDFFYQSKPKYLQGKSYDAFI